MKNVNQDDAVERMLNQLEGLLKRQHSKAPEPRRADAVLDDDTHDQDDSDDPLQAGVKPHSSDSQSRPRVQDLLASESELEAARAVASEYGSDTTAPETDPDDPDTAATELDSRDQEGTAPEGHADEPEVASEETMANNSDSLPQQTIAYDPDATPREMDAYDPEVARRELGISGADPVSSVSEAGDAAVPSEPETMAPRPAFEPRYPLAPDSVAGVDAEAGVEGEEPPRMEPDLESLAPESLEHEGGTGMTRRLTTRLGQLLVDSNVLSESQLQSALKHQRETGQRLGEVLVNERYIDESALLSVLESQYGVPAAGLDDIDLDADLAKLVPHDMARRYLLVPLALHEDAVDVAMVDPTDFVAMAHVRFATGLRPNVFITTVTAAQRAIARLYTDEEAEISEQPEDPAEAVKRMILDRDSMLIAADQDPRKFYELAASIDAFVDEILRKASGSS